MSFTIGHGNDPPFKSLRLEQKLRLLMARLCRNKFSFFYMPESWLSDENQCPEEIIKAVNKYTKERVYVWPRQLLPRFEDIKKIQDLFFNLPNTKTVAESYADSQVLYAMNLRQMYAREDKWLENLSNSKFLKKMFSSSVGNDFLENMLLASHLSHYFESRIDRAALLSELYHAYISYPKNYLSSDFDFLGIPSNYERHPKVDQELLPLPFAIAAILPFSVETNNAIQKYLNYRKKYLDNKIKVTSVFKYLTNLALHSDSMLFDKDPESNYKDIDVASERTVPGYTIIRKIGEGAYKEVWKVREDSPIKRDLIYKYIKPDPDIISFEELKFSSHDEQNLKKAGGLDNLVKNELVQIEKLRLKGLPVPQLHQILPDGWIEDYIEGQNLEQKYEKLRKQFGPLSPEVVHSACEDFRIIYDLLQKIHKEGVLHRDIKLENFIQEKNTGQIYVTDFGLSLKGVFGARIYAAPEVLRSNGEEYTEQSEGWSFGVALYHAITGEYPFGSDKYETIEILKDEELTEKRKTQALLRLPNEYSKLFSLLYDNWNYEPKNRLLTGDFITLFLKAKPSDQETVDIIRSSFQITDLLNNMKTQIETKAPNDIKSAYQRAVQDIKKVFDWGHS